MKKIRLGPVAIFLTIISIVLACLAMLTVATSNADASLARRFAEVTAVRYELRSEGMRFIKEAEEYAKDRGALPEGASEQDGSLVFTKEKGGYVLNVSLSVNDGEAAVTEWKINRTWEFEDPFDDLWNGR